jgi:hypothetical protein
MSVQTQIDRIDGNVKKALAKIAEKGVAVASDANSDDLESLIAAIESGGFAMGSITIASDANYADIEHNLGKVPSGGIFMVPYIVPGSYLLLADINGGRYYTFYSSGSIGGSATPGGTTSILTSNIPSGTKISNSGLYKATESTIRVGNERMSNPFILAGVEYVWIVW